MKISINLDQQALLQFGVIFIVLIVATLFIVMYKKRVRSTKSTSVLQDTYAFDDTQNIRHPSKCYACERQSTKSYPTKCFDCEKQESQAHWQASYGSPKMFAGL